MKNIVFFFSTVFFISSCSNINSSSNLVNTEENSTNNLELEAKQTKIKVIDTDFSKGRLTNKQELTLWDVQKMHGHLCDGLVVGFLGLREGLYELYPDSLIDRTNVRIVSKSSPCLGDIAMYLTGARYQFNSFYVDNTINGIYIVQRIDNGKTVSIRLKDGIKPNKINELGAIAIKHELDACSLDSLRILEDEFAAELFTYLPKDIYQIEILNEFKWLPVLSNEYQKTDILNKNASNCK